MSSTYSKFVKVRGYQDIYDKTSDAICIIDIEIGTVVYSNSEAQRLFKLSREEFLTTSLIDMSPEIQYGKETLESASRYIQEALHGGNPVFDWFHQDSEGTVIPCEVRLIRLPPYKRKLLRGTLIDKRKQKQSKIELDFENEILAIPAHDISLGHYEWIPGEKLYGDEQMHHIFGFPKNSKEDMEEYFFRTIHPLDRERVAVNLSARMELKSKQDFFKDKFRILREGQLVHVQAYGLVFRDDNENPQRIVGTCQDISEKEKARESIQESEKLLRLTLDGLSSNIALLDEKGEILLVNKAWRNFAEKNGTKSLLVSEGVNYFEVCFVAKGEEVTDARIFAEGIRKVLSAELDFFTMEYTCHSPTEKRWFIGNVTPFHGKDQSLVIVAHENITVKKEIELQKFRTRQLEIKQNELKASNKDLSELNVILKKFVFAASHDLKQPLINVNNFQSLFIKKYGELIDSTGHKYLKVISDNIDLLESMLHDFLIYAKFIKKKGRNEIIDLNDVIQDIGNLHLFDSAEIIYTDLPNIKGSLTQIHRLFQNLFSNAIKFNKHENPVIKITSNIKENHAEIRVSDDGIGIQKEYLSIVFDEFQRLDKSKYPGSGLGLTICKEIVANHGGKITAEINDLGGTDMIFQLSLHGE